MLNFKFIFEIKHKNSYIQKCRTFFIQEDENLISAVPLT